MENIMTFTRTNQDLLRQVSSAYYDLELRYAGRDFFLISDQRTTHNATLGYLIAELLKKATKAWKKGAALYHWDGWQVIPAKQREVDEHLFQHLPTYWRLDYTLSPTGIPQVFEIDSNQWGREFLVGLQKCFGFETTMADLWPHKNGLVVQSLTTCWDTLPYFLKKVGGSQIHVRDFNSEHLEYGIIERYFRFNFDNPNSDEMKLLQYALDQKLRIQPVPTSILSKLLFATVWDSSLEEEWKSVGLNLDPIRQIIPETHLLTQEWKEAIAESRKKWVLKSLDHASEAGSRGVSVGCRQGAKQWRDQLQRAHPYSIVTAYTPHFQHPLTFINPNGKIDETNLDIIFRPFHGIDGKFLGGVYTAGVAGTHAGKIHGGHDMVFGLLDY